MNSKELRKWIIIPTLKILELYNDETKENSYESECQVRLLLGTAAQESNMGQYFRQQGFCGSENGAFGIYQIEKQSHELALTWLQINNAKMLSKVLSLRSKLLNINPLDHLIFNLYYATAVARIIYLSIKEPLPHHEDIKAIAEYYKKYYNRNGKATAEQFIDNFIKHRC
jgi:hypothetical protein